MQDVVLNGIGRNLAAIKAAVAEQMACDGDDLDGLTAQVRFESSRPGGWIFAGDVAVKARRGGEERDDPSALLLFVDGVDVEGDAEALRPHGDFVDRALWNVARLTLRAVGHDPHAGLRGTLEVDLLNGRLGRLTSGGETAPQRETDLGPLRAALAQT